MQLYSDKTSRTTYQPHQRVEAACVPIHIGGDNHSSENVRCRASLFGIFDKPRRSCRLHTATHVVAVVKQHTSLHNPGFANKESA
jgi:hypothetical protein